MTASSLPTTGLPPHPRWLTGRYALLAELGRGGSSVVYRARDDVTGREVAVKVVDHGLDGPGDAAAQAAREARVAAALRHPHIVETFAVEAGDGVSAVVSAYVPGGTLRAALRAAAAAGEGWAYDRVAAVLRDVASALAYAHARGVVHRDVKPENVFLTDDGRALLADFGIAHAPGHGGAEDDDPGGGGVTGTPTYMAPEQVAGAPADARADVYALGLVGWEMLAGRRPWQGEPLYAVLHKQRYEALPSLAALRPDIPAYLLATVERALAKTPAARWPDGAAFLDALTPTPAQLPPIDVRLAADDANLATARVVTPARDARAVSTSPEAPAAWRTRRRLPATALVAVAGCLTVGAVLARGLSERAPAGVETRVTRAALGEVEPVRAVAPAATRAPGPVPPGATDAAANAPSADALAREVRAADGRVRAAYDALLDAIRASAGGGWEPRAVRVLQEEQRRWERAGTAACKAVAPPAADLVAAAACRVARANERARALTVRRARFAVDGTSARDGGGDEARPIP